MIGSRRTRIALVALAVGGILAATTFPTPAADLGRIGLCLVCGERGVADALLNLLLFAPLGALLWIAGWRAGRIVGGAALLSAAIELAQLLVVAGRDPNIGDVLFNTLGAAAGAGLVASSARWIAPTPARAAALAWTWTALIIASVAATGWLLDPAMSHADYHGAWTPRLGHLAAYDGRVLEAALGSMPLRSTLMEDSDAARSALLSGGRIHVRAIAGSAPSRVAPIIMVNDEHQHEMMLLGVDRDDLVLRYRTRSTALRLDQPDVRAVGMMRGTTPEMPLVLEAWRDEAGTNCLRRNDALRCGLGFSPGSAWTILMYGEHFPNWLTRALDITWIAALFLPLGFWIRMAPRAGWSLVPAGLALLLAPAFTGLLATPAPQLAAACLALLGGALIAGVVRPRRDEIASPSATAPRVDTVDPVRGMS